ncbi:hypothetical protein OPV22_015239 [Ensete ventricosum]|uniref:Uncharacterized protein n=1 Tax=Ensete ventricosum TaxID=4639 RepID=A0AAV8R534_ENSVE|nr:hypothetical protein OPV22_015239 [Ensete ventricosum]
MAGPQPETEVDRQLLFLTCLLIHIWENGFPAIVKNLLGHDEMKLSAMRAHVQLQGFIVLFLCSSGKRFSKLFMHLVGVKTSTPGTSRHSIALDLPWLPYTSTAKEIPVVGDEGSKG